MNQILCDGCKEIQDPGSDRIWFSFAPLVLHPFRGAYHACSLDCISRILIDYFGILAVKTSVSFAGHTPTNPKP